MQGVAVDPGAVHTGVAWFEWDRNGGTVVDTWEATFEEFPVWLHATCSGNKLDVVVYERFRLFGDKALQQTGSEMETSQLIGTIKFICELTGVPVVGQQPDIKVPTAAILRKRNIKSLAAKQGTGGHAKDAELHAYRYLESVKSKWTGKPDEPEVTGYAKA